MFVARREGRREERVARGEGGACLAFSSQAGPLKDTDTVDFCLVSVSFHGPAHVWPSVRKAATGQSRPCCLSKEWKTMKKKRDRPKRLGLRETTRQRRVRPRPHPGRVRAPRRFPSPTRSESRGTASPLAPSAASPPAHSPRFEPPALNPPGINRRMRTLTGGWPTHRESRCESSAVLARYS